MELKERRTCIVLCFTAVLFLSATYFYYPFSVHPYCSSDCTDVLISSRLRLLLFSVFISFFLFLTIFSINTLKTSGHLFDSPWNTKLNALFIIFFSLIPVVISTSFFLNARIVVPVSHTEYAKNALVSASLEDNSLDVTLFNVPLHSTAGFSVSSSFKLEVFCMQNDRKSLTNLSDFFYGNPYISLLSSFSFSLSDNNYHGVFELGSHSCSISNMFVLISPVGQHLFELSAGELITGEVIHDSFLVDFRFLISSFE
ncbi:hypothetical protein RCL1_003162 [Eukaryota sp. TZLM3-RCL]